MELSTPVAFLIFNRPDLTALSFQCIRQAKPQKLLVIADGFRRNRAGEQEKCQAARSVISKVDWDCEVLTNYSDINLGCKNRVSSGLDWVFSLVEEAIILEDDCLPTQSFFYYCQNLLNYYRNDERIMHIGGVNYQEGHQRSAYSYYFSKYPHIWGWASWRRAWKHYDVSMKSWPKLSETGIIESLCDNSYEQRYWMKTFESTFQNQIDTWDTQWLYTCWTQNGLAILPEVNLVSNIGFRADATHTTIGHRFSNVPTEELWDLIHPPYVYRQHQADTYTADYFFGGKPLKNPVALFTKLKGRLSNAGQKLKRYLNL